VPPGGENQPDGSVAARVDESVVLSPRMLLSVFRAVAQLVFDLLLRPMVGEYLVHKPGTGRIRLATEHILVRGSDDRLRLVPGHLSIGPI
jgi:hypothetical protein